LNSLQATVDGDNVSILDLAKNIEIVSNTIYSDFADNNGDPWGNSGSEVVNALNAIFSSSGTPTTNLPVITSSLAVSLVTGDTLNYELTADYGVGYEWDFSNVSGIATVEGNIRKIVGGSSLTAGTYNIPVKAINYNGEDSETIVLTVAAPAFANTKSVQFDSQDFLEGSASAVSATLGRAANGSGSGDAWSISMWFKPSTSTNGTQTLMFYGDTDTTLNGYMKIQFRGSPNSIRFQYGSNSDYLRFISATNTFTDNVWSHILVTYDGGTTGNVPADLADYESRFTFFVDGVDVTSGGSWTDGNNGWAGSINAGYFRVGRDDGTGYIRGQAKVDEVALWDSDQSANIAAIYNNGSPLDLSDLTEAPKHWWRMGDGDTFPNLLDSGSEANCTFVMNNMTSADIVSDTP
jgi:hypothetical protein